MMIMMVMKKSDDDNKENKDKDYVLSKSRKKEPARITASVPRNLVLWTEQSHQAALQ